MVCKVARSRSKEVHFDQFDVKPFFKGIAREHLFTFFNFNLTTTVDMLDSIRKNGK